MRMPLALVFLGCSHTSAISGEPDSSTQGDVTSPPSDAGPTDAMAPLDGSMPKPGGYTLMNVTCPDASVRYVFLPLPGKKTADLVGVQTCYHLATGAFQNGATIQCLGQPIVKDDEVGAYCPNQADYMIFAVPN